jgi:transposase-like protein
MTNDKLPKTLQEAIQIFTDETKCIEFLAKVRWPKGQAKCPKCNAQRSSFMSTRKTFLCLECKKQFSVKQGTIFEDSAIPLHKWLAAFWLVSNAKNGISSHELGRALGITQKSAWHMGHRIRLALQNGSIETMGGEGETIEVDETYIGAKARNMHWDKRKARFQGRTGGFGKQAVFGMLHRDKAGKSKVIARAIPANWRDDVRQIIKESALPGSTIYSDEHGTYSKLNSQGFVHDFVRHAETYVKGAVHTNGIENFWSLLKRCILGTHVSIEPFHTFRYLDEEAFRFNERFGNEQDRFMTALSGIVGKRLTFAEVTGNAPASIEGAEPV